MAGVKKQSNLSQTVCEDRLGLEEAGEDSRLRLPEGEFDWGPGQQQMLLGSYYWGYTAAQIPAAWLATKIGFRFAFGGAMLAGSLLTLLFPLAARSSVYLAVAARILLGLFHAVSFPAMTGAWGAWAPPLEKTQLNGIAVSGASIGTLVIFTLAGYIADTLGWPAVFYVTGASSLVWSLAWLLLVADTPATHPYISSQEREFVMTAVGGREDLDRRRLVTPWRHILTSVPVWGIVLGHAASNWGNYTLNQQLPTYLSNVLRYSLSFNGLLASLCYLIQWLVCLLGSWATDSLRSRQVLRTITIRKLNTMLGLWLTGLASVLAVYAGCQAELAVALFAVAAGLNTMTVSGCKTGMLDIAPDYAGIVFGVSNTVSNIPGFVGPLIVGSVLTDYSNTTQWKTVFWISFSVHILGSLLYLTKGSAALQDWAVPVPDEKEKTEQNEEPLEDGFTEIKL